MKLFILDDYRIGTKLHFNTLLTRVNNGLYGLANTASFPSLPMTKAAYMLLVSNCRDANNEYEAGGVDQKPAYDTALTAMIIGLDLGKEYVEGLPGLSVDLVNLSGYTLNKQSISSSVVPSPANLRQINRLGGGTMSFEYDPVEGAEFYGTYLVEGNAWPDGYTFINGILDFPKLANARLLHNGLKQRLKVYFNLVNNQEYTIFSYTGNSAGVSTLSVGTTFTASNK